ncbi:uncharacterized protein spmip4 isoform X1 [Hippocampus comes]|uniref:uncharacterized protein spmip4 isoform X1 n=2 Tax=Hippocampus comes TaxID=109280 RepID=UPI00094E93D0|nr:PREDICTED: uncharacterized protein C7orf31 homolog isoform X1 [Hippocampus comes]
MPPQWLPPLYNSNPNESFHGGKKKICSSLQSSHRSFCNQMESSAVNNSVRQTVSHSHISDVTKKSDAPLSDQLVPNPTDVNVVEKAAKTAIPREHPYASHISRFEMFPSFRSSGDHRAGFRPALFPFISPIVPTTPKVTVLSKTKGGPYRHEILEIPTRAKTAKWPGEISYTDRPKPVRGVRHALYAAPTRAVLPNPKICDGDLTASDWTSNMLRSMDRMHWITSYQMHYQGLQQACKIDDFREKMSEPTGRTSHSAPLGTERDRSVYVLVPSKLRQRRRQGRNTKSTYADMFSPATNQGATSARIQRICPMCQCNKTTGPQNVVSDPSRAVSGGTEATESNQAESKEAAKVHFDESLTRPPASTNEQGARRKLSRLRVLPGIAPGGRAAGMRAGAGDGLLGLQGNYSRTNAHHNFNSSVKYASLDLRDNIFTGKKHNFYGLNCNIIH